MKKSGLAALLASVAAIICACSGNLFTTFSNEKSDASLLFQAQQDVDGGNYAGALPLFPQMSTAYQEAPNVISLWAAAYSGEAGLNFGNLVTNFTSIGSTPVLLFLMQNFDGGTTANITNLQDAQSLMWSISPNSYAGFTQDQLLQLVTVAMADIGTIISNQADPTGTGSVTGGFSTCSGYTNAQLQEFGTSLNIVMNGLTQLSTEGVNFGPSISTLTNGCTELQTAGAAYNFCTVGYGTAFTASQLTALEAIMGDGTIIGISACGGTISGGTCCGL